MADEQDLAPREEAPTEAAPGASRLTRTWRILAIAICVVVVDQLTKAWAVNRLHRGVVDVIGSLRFNLAYNSGTAFSFGQGQNIGPIVALLAIVVIVLFMLSGNATRRLSGTVAAGLVIGGALGNLADRAFRGHAGFLHGSVVDFIDLQWWPVFNVADAMIVVGAGLAVLTSFRSPQA